MVNDYLSADKLYERLWAQGKTLKDVEREYTLYVYSKCGGKPGETAAMLEISVRTLFNRLQQYKERKDADIPG